jgi:hypothetical protein
MTSVIIQDVRITFVKALYLKQVEPSKQEFNYLNVKEKRNDPTS